MHLYMILPYTYVHGILYKFIHDIFCLKCRLYILMSSLNSAHFQVTIHPNTLTCIKGLFFLTLDSLS